jgi:uncharacterized protein YbjT (DUF2867 family)
MKILLTGATGYIGKRLLPVLIKMGHRVVCCVRDKKRFSIPKSLVSMAEVIKLDLLDEKTLENIPDDIDGAFYLVHSMSSAKNFAELERASAINFRTKLQTTNVRHVVYLGGIINEDHLSEHLASRKQVEDELAIGDYHFTSLRAGIIIGSGSGSFEIIRDLVEKLPIMVAPKWLKTRCQPIAISDVVEVLSKVLFHEKAFDNNFDIGGPDILNYKQMLLEFAKVRNLRRLIVTVPVMTPRLSSYWLYFVTSTSYTLSVALVKSMKVEVVCRDNRLMGMLGVKPIGYKEGIRRAFEQTVNNSVISSWKDAYVSGGLDIDLSEFLEVPQFGCFKDIRRAPVEDREGCIDRIWAIGGKKGWYHANWLWVLRGFIDKIFGGVGLRRGRTNATCIQAGDALDFWRVLYADKAKGRLLLFAEMKLPGEAWLEFKIEDGFLVQTATFRPLGLLGRLYWCLVVPLHEVVFRGLVKKLVASTR